MRFICADGGNHWALVSAAYGGEPAIVGTTIDIKEQKQVPYALRRVNWKLNLLVNAIRYDILNQLMAFIGYLKFSREDIKATRVLTYVTIKEQ
ncbi:MAG: hypothetical protein WCF90_04655, partial [Methanomicrobiales archaeon]